MLIPLTEPTAPRYIYVNPVNNLMHLFVPLVNGQEISTDNTCKASKALDDFFKNGEAKRELDAYKSALEFDLHILENAHPQKELKQKRLEQTKIYIAALTAVANNYSTAIAKLMQIPSNLYSIQLRPHDVDIHSKVVKPVFNIRRETDKKGTPRSALYNAMYRAYPNAIICSPQAQLEKALKMALPNEPPDFNAIQSTLKNQCQHLFKLDIDFTTSSDGTPVSQASIDELMGFSLETPATTKDYLDALLGRCAPNIWENINISPFYLPDNLDNTEKLSLLTQFFLAQANIWCTANKISPKNFGVLLDASSSLSKQVAHLVVSTLSTGASVEAHLVTFLNEHHAQFGLSQLLSVHELGAIKQQFERTWKTVTATKENPHMDDFMILDTTSASGNFVTHQGSICTDFSVLIKAGFQQLNSYYFQRIREDFNNAFIAKVPHSNPQIKVCVDMDMDSLLLHFNEEQCKTLPQEVQDEYVKSPAFPLRTFLHHVAKGRQVEAESMLSANEEEQTLLLTKSTFTDYSGRTFTCSAYEYAYWAKDTHMCRMLKKYMSNETKEVMLKRVETIEEVGLTYTQHNKTIHGSKHFSFAPLKAALQAYVDGHAQWVNNYDWDALKDAWMKVGIAQRDIPAHVAQEYCWPGRSFNPLPRFDEDTLSRSLKFYNYKTSTHNHWFPIVLTDSSGLGIDFALLRTWESKKEVNEPARAEGTWLTAQAKYDLAAMTHLDDVRTAELRLSRENLRPLEQEYSLVMSY